MVLALEGPGYEWWDGYRDYDRQWIELIDENEHDTGNCLCADHGHTMFRQDWRPGRELSAVQARAWARMQESYFPHLHDPVADDMIARMISREARRDLPAARPAERRTIDLGPTVRGTVEGIIGNFTPEQERILGLALRRGRITYTFGNIARDREGLPRFGESRESWERRHHG